MNELALFWWDGLDATKIEVLNGKIDRPIAVEVKIARLGTTVCVGPGAPIDRLDFFKRLFG